MQVGINVYLLRQDFLLKINKCIVPNKCVYIGGIFFHFLISDLFVYSELQSTYLRENHMYAVLFQFSIIIRSREARLHTILFVKLKCPNSLNCTLRFDEKICLLRPSFVTSFHISASGLCCSAKFRFRLTPPELSVVSTYSKQAKNS